MLPLLSDGETGILLDKMQFRQNVAAYLPGKGNNRGSHTHSTYRLAGASSFSGPSSIAGPITAKLKSGKRKSGIPAISSGALP